MDGSSTQKQETCPFPRSKVVAPFFLFETHQQNTPHKSEKERLTTTANSLTNECSRNFGYILFLKPPLSKSTSQRHTFIFFSFLFPTKQKHFSLLIYDTLHVGKKPQTGKSRLPAGSPHRLGDVQRKSSVRRYPKRRCVRQEKGSPSFHKARPPYKIPYINRVGKVRRLIYRPKFFQF